MNKHTLRQIENVHLSLSPLEGGKKPEENDPEKEVKTLHALTAADHDEQYQEEYEQAEDIYERFKAQTKLLDRQQVLEED